ncbi:VOC family protein [Actinomadura sp. HBU206391]|uniref:VOC family protein n=1 Tax=Actinomadura sp. HBU206391 TaxID=2731692 RepID=UPI00164F4D7F|nr:VOC family protein [Actinomadura sp. HBU206391]MBC6460251.1 VOC family protein [Actinomadura sp. HBU206391]
MITESHPAGAPAWVEIAVPDVAEAREFYGSLFGWEFEGGSPAAGGYTTCLLHGEPVAGITGTGDGPARRWTTFFATDDADATARRITEAGGSLVLAPREVADQGRVALGEDPAGVLFAVWQGREHQGARIVAEPGAMAWHELGTADPAMAVRFYGAVLDRPVRSMGIAGFDYWTVLAGEDSVAGIWSEPRAPRQWMTYFSVDDADEAARRVTAAGGRVLRGPIDSPQGRVAVVADPFDALLAVIRLPGE